MKEENDSNLAPNSQTHKMVNHDSQQNQMVTNMFAGSVAAMAEVMINHPLFSMKLDQQAGGEKVPSMAYSRRIMGLYRGIAPNMASMVPITSIQMVVGHYVESKLKDQNSYIGEFSQPVAGFFGGVAGATVAGPVEFYLTQQRVQNVLRQQEMKKPYSFIETVKNTNIRHGATICRTGFVGTAGRDAIFTTGYLFAVPWFRNILEQKKVSASQAILIANLGMGAMVAAVTQPIDTIKTRQQQVEPTLRLSYWNAMKSIYHRYGIFGFYRGSGPRCLRVVSAVTIIGSVSEKIRSSL